MSDMRLTSSKTKMKINLCIFLLCNTAVSGQSVELNGSLGESVKFPATVKKDGSLMHIGVRIGIVTSGRFTAAKFKDRLQWDSSTGLFSLSGLKMEDNGEYKVQNTDQNINTVFQLNVYKDNAVSVFGEPQKLNGILGESVKFPAAVKIKGNLTHSGVTIGEVTGGRLTAAIDVERVNWDSSTGYFNLSGLKLEESGVYTVEKDDGQKSVSFSLTVWKDNVPVSKPHLSVTHNEYRCTVLCAAAGGTRATLTLYKNGEKNPYVTSPVRSHPHLDMTVPVESGTYTCEAKNSVSRNTSDPLTVGTHCTGGAAGIWQAEGSKMWSLCLVLIVMLCSRLV